MLLFLCRKPLTYLSKSYKPYFNPIWMPEKSSEKSKNFYSSNIIYLLSYLSINQNAQQHFAQL